MQWGGCFDLSATVCFLDWQVVDVACTAVSVRIVGEQCRSGSYGRMGLAVCSRMEMDTGTTA
jgi:hypothetical protein